MSSLVPRERSMFRCAEVSYFKPRYRNSFLRLPSHCRRLIAEVYENNKHGTLFSMIIAIEATIIMPIVILE